MTSLESVTVDQALFGYSDGHRQIAASLRLSSKDQYQLAAATDLASGASLNDDESYLTGLPLPESRHFALIRTWSAPEMPRPGCVWSHVVLIEPRLLAAHSDLADFLWLLKRPSRGEERVYEEPLKLLASERRSPLPDRRTISILISQYYSGQRVVLDPNVPAPELEAAVMAVWSQQWPRLRNAFSFRTAPGAERRRSELVDYDVQVGYDNESPSKDAHEDWIVAGASDAAARKVTPLRRFLWRYGRDLSSSRKSYRTLVELFLAVTSSAELTAREAIRIFEAIPDVTDGETLKRDILGIGSSSPALFRPLAPEELVRLLASPTANSLALEEGLRKRFQSILPSQVPALADFVERHGNELGRWSEEIDAGLVSAADRDALLGPLPGRIRRLVLKSRPELIDRDTVSSLSDEALIDVASGPQIGTASNALAFTAVRRDLGTANDRIFQTITADTFGAAIEAAIKGQLDPSWYRTISSNSAFVFRTKWPAEVATTTGLSVGLALLRFPTREEWTPDFWVKLLATLRDDAKGEERLRLHAFLLRVALQIPSRATWKIAIFVLPEIRPIVLRNALPNDVYYMLGSDLPKFSSVAYWDLDKRILMSLSYLREKYPDDKSLRALNLSEDEMDTVLYGAQKESERRRGGLWSWL